MLQLSWQLAPAWRFSKLSTQGQIPFPADAVVANGVCTGLDIAFTNFGQRSLDVSFLTMIKGTVPMWLLLFGFIFGLEKITWRLCGILSVIVIGLGLLVGGEGAFTIWGFCLVMLASVCAGKLGRHGYGLCFDNKNMVLACTV